MKTINITSGLFLLFLLSACSGKGSYNYDQTNFTLGEATKTQVVNKMGLPQKIQRDRYGYEHYIYEGKRHFTKVCTDCDETLEESEGDKMPVMISHALIGIGAEFVFNRKSILISKFTRVK